MKVQTNGSMCNKRGWGTKSHMESGSSRSQVARTAIVCVLIGAVCGVFEYFLVPGHNQHVGHLTYAIIAGTVIAGFSFYRIRARRAGRDPIYNVGRELRHQRQDQLGEGGRPLDPGEEPQVVEAEPRRHH